VPKAAWHCFPIAPNAQCKMGCCVGNGETDKMTIFVKLKTSYTSLASKFLCDSFAMKHCLVTKVQKQQKVTPMFHKRVFNKSDHPLTIFKTDNQTNLLGKKVRLSDHFWASNRTFEDLGLGYKGVMRDSINYNQYDRQYIKCCTD